MAVIVWLIAQGLSAPTAALAATIGVYAAPVLLGLGLVAVMERPPTLRPCPPRRGATRHIPGQP